MDVAPFTMLPENKNLPHRMSHGNALKIEHRTDSGAAVDGVVTLQPQWVISERMNDYRKSCVLMIQSVSRMLLQPLHTPISTNCFIKQAINPADFAMIKI